MENFEDRYQKKHKLLSFIKSGIRIASCFFALLSVDAKIAVGIVALGFLIAEVVGIFEEMI